MGIRNVFVIILLFSTIVPSALFGAWAYRDGVSSEFEEVSDRHLLIAKNLGSALNRYSRDIEALMDSVGTALSKWGSYPRVNNALSALNVDIVGIIDLDTRAVKASISRDQVSIAYASRHILSPEVFGLMDKPTRQIAFTTVMASPSSEDENVIYAYKAMDNLLLFARVNTGYFVELGNEISFGVKGHAAIVDQAGNVLAHPLKGWIKQRKNISAVSSVQRMMGGETGVEVFYSPALKGDMIAGFTSVPRTGWGVMIPQPVEELYDKVAENNSGIMLALLASASIICVSMLVVMKVFGQPISTFTKQLRQNAKTGKLSPISLPEKRFVLTEFKEFGNAYNALIHTVESAHTEIHELAFTDSVTKLPNRAQFQKKVEEVLNSPAECSKGGSLLFVDIDDFKMVNDLFGHELGDHVLKLISQKLVSSVDPAQSAGIAGLDANTRNACVSRIGGDEFAIFLPGVVDERDLSDFLGKLVDDIFQLNNELMIEVNCSASIGAARFPMDGTDVTSLMRSADIAMYRAKSSGKNQSVIFSSKLGTMTENEICADFSNAIREGQLVLEYQPKVCTRRQAVAGAEALVRWNHPKLGRLSPGVWMSAIASKQQAIDLGEWVIEQAMRDLSIWNKRKSGLKMAINVSPIQLRNSDIVEHLKEALDRYGIDPEMFELEITEDALFEHSESAQSLLNEISQLGIKISIDDFGTGYSNLSRLTGLPIDFIKIDQSLTRKALVDKKVESVMEATITLAKNLDCFVVAEGVETLEIAEFATAKGANLLQGFLFSKALPSEDFLNWIDEAGCDQLVRYSRRMDRDAA